MRRARLMDRPAARHPFLAHLPAEMRYRVSAVVTRHTGYVATELPVPHADLQHAVFGQSHVHMGQTMTEDTPDFTQLTIPP